MSGERMSPHQLANLRALPVEEFRSWGNPNTIPALLATIAERDAEVDRLALDNARLSADLEAAQRINDAAKQVAEDPSLLHDMAEVCALYLDDPTQGYAHLMVDLATRVDALAAALAEDPEPPQAAGTET